MTKILLKSAQNLETETGNVSHVSLALHPGLDRAVVLVGIHPAEVRLQGVGVEHVFLLQPRLKTSSPIVFNVVHNFIASLWFREIYSDHLQSGHTRRGSEAPSTARRSRRFWRICRAREACCPPGSSCRRTAIVEAQARTQCRQ